MSLSECALSSNSMSPSFLARPRTHRLACRHPVVAVAAAMESKRCSRAGERHKKEKAVGNAKSEKLMVRLLLFSKTKQKDG